jgi:hypothetical protein
MSFGGSIQHLNIKIIADGFGAKGFPWWFPLRHGRRKLVLN